MKVCSRSFLIGYREEYGGSISLSSRSLTIFVVANKPLCEYLFAFAFFVLYCRTLYSFCDNNTDEFRLSLRNNVEREVITNDDDEMHTD